MNEKLKKIFIASIVIIILFSCNVLNETNNQSNTPVAVPTPDEIEGFFVNDGKLYDANGFEFQMRGVNANHNWNNSGQPSGDLYLEQIKYIKATGANAVRVTFAPHASNDPYKFVCLTIEEREEVIAEYVKYHIVPVVAYHNATGCNNPERVYQAVDFWIGEKEWLDKYGKFVILNITNEWGRNDNYGKEEDYHLGSSPEEWFDTYKEAITRLREAGIKNLLVIDSFNYAASAQTILDYGQQLLDHDPMHNILFSIHTYGGWYSSQTALTNPEKIENEEKWERRHTNWNAEYALNLLKEKKLPIMIGEFSRQCAIIDAGGDCAPDVELINDFDDYGVGWLYWMWHNWKAGSYVQMVRSADSFEYLPHSEPVMEKLRDSPEATIFDGTLPELPIRDITPEPNYNPGSVFVEHWVGEEDPIKWPPEKQDIFGDRFPDDFIQITFVKDKNSGADNATYDFLWNNPDMVPTYLQIEIENETGENSFTMLYYSHNYAYKTKDLKHDEFYGKNVRFWFYLEDGSIAKTEWDTYEYENVFEIDS